MMTDENAAIIAAFNDVLEDVEDWFVATFMARVEVPIENGDKLVLMKWNGRRGLYIICDGKPDPVALSNASLTVRRYVASQALVPLENAARVAEDDFRQQIVVATEVAQAFMVQRTKREPTP